MFNTSDKGNVPVFLQKTEYHEKILVIIGHNHLRNYQKESFKKL